MKKLILLSYFLFLCISVNAQRNIQKVIVERDTIEVYNTDLILGVSIVLITVEKIIIKMMNF